MFNKYTLFSLVLLLAFSIIQCRNVADIDNSVESDDEYDPEDFEDILKSNLDIDFDDEEPDDKFCEWHTCSVDIREPRGIASIFDFPFLKKLIKHWNIFKTPEMQMRFFLFRRDFPDCGRELEIDDDERTLLGKGFNPNDPTRIIVHGWMSQTRGSLNRDVKSGYLQAGSFNVIVADWSESSSNLNYFTVVTMIEGFGGRLADFTKHLNAELHVSFNDMYIIGHSLGAQIAGAAGKLIKPNQYNTIFALDPAGPKFRRLPPEFRIDPTDAKYVESIQTSGNLGFLRPTGSATFYPNWGKLQKSCFFPGCSHVRAYKMFAESLNSTLGFWGARCSQRAPKWICENSRRHRMGGEPSMPKRGLFYVDTNSKSPFALGK